jgi:pepF/M3 family oligoendopeptidase
MTTADAPAGLPRWDVTDIHASLDSRSFVAELERAEADAERLVALFDELGIGATEPRAPTADDGAATDRAVAAWNESTERFHELVAYVYATVSTDSRNDLAQGLLARLEMADARTAPLLGRLAEWVKALGAEGLAGVSAAAADHRGPLQRLEARAAHQMPQAEEELYAELGPTGGSAWERLHSDLTSQLTAEVGLPDGTRDRRPMAAVRGLAAHPDPAVRRAAYDAEMIAWPTVMVPAAAAMNAIKGEANVVNRRRAWASPLDASLFANAVSRRTFDALQAAVSASLPDFRAWMRTKARLHGHQGGLPWWDLVAPLPVAPGTVAWDDALSQVHAAFGAYSDHLAGLVTRAVGERWIDAEPRDGKRGGAFCMGVRADRSLVFLNWNGSADGVRTAAHELGHAYHNTQLAHRTPLQRRLPMALAETASIFCETLMVEWGLAAATGTERLALLDVDLQSANQVVVDIHSRVLFETEVFARRQRRTLSPTELCSIMTDAQAQAYGDGIDTATAHPYMWVVKPHYYGSHFYNWPYTYGSLFGLGLFARYREDPERFRAGYDDMLSRAGMDTAEELGAAFGIDVTDEGFWTASLDVLRGRMADYARLAEHHGSAGTAR